MDRRNFLGLAAKGAVGAATIGLVGCSGNQTEDAPVTDAETIAEAVASDSSLPEVSWQMATSWPPSLDTLFGGAELVGKRVAAITGGKFTIDVRSAGELAPGLEVLNVVEQGAVPIGHTASYYYVGKSPATAFGTALPFGFNYRQQNAWLYQGGGLDLLRQLYADKFGVIQFPAGNTGQQMGGWFNKEVETVADMQGLKMRIPGLGGQVMNKLGVTVQVIAGGEIFQALQTGAIDAAEWVGPYDDEKLGFHEASKFYYAPGWWEPAPTLEIQVNLDKYNELPEEYQAALETAAYQSNMEMMALYDARNQEALQRLVDAGVQLRVFSDEILKASEEAAFSLYDELSQEDGDFKAIFAEWKQFRDSIQKWFSANEALYAAYTQGSLQN
ncbi:MAG TPA: ABC transporter substrate-binding protein [Chloroflexi bacterium]|nr:ABC transporter substrate-binding protein [Chloroflexota bacterium]